ncbi:lipopolysaccharide biosynthesis protein [Parasphingorhabdus cellanae]|nr:oligosaccharide flippase family protein [Parasphingorhabdus cellanae]
MLASAKKSDFARNLSWQYVANIGVGVLGALYLLLVAANLGAAEFGLYSIVISLPTIIFLILDARMQEAYIYFHAQQHKKTMHPLLGPLLSIELALRLLSLLLGLFFVAFAGRLLLDPQGLIPAAAGCVFIFLAKTTNGLTTGMLRVAGKLDLVAKTQLMDWTLRIGTIGILWSIDQITILNLIIGQALSGLVFNLFMFVQASRTIDGPSKIPKLADMASSWNFFRDNRRIFLSNQVTNASESIAKELDVIVISLFVALPTVGAYKLAKSCVSIIWRLGDPIYIVIMPRLAELVAANRSAELMALVKKLSLALLALGLFLYLGGIFGVWIVFTYLYSAEFDQVPTLFFWMAWAIFVTLPIIWAHPLAASHGRPDLQTAASVSGNLIGLSVIAVGSAQFGANGAAVGAATAMCLPMVICVIILRIKGYLHA